MADERTLAFLHDLQREDEEAAAALAELDELALETEAIRSRATELDAFLTRLPAERERVRGARDDARRELESRHRELERAQAELAQAENRRDAERLAAARRSEVRARDLAGMAERRLRAAEEEQEKLEGEAGEAERETEAVARGARGLAGELRGRSALAGGAGNAPGPALDEVARWATDARAALFVARGRLATEREALIRQANELGAAVLGEPLAAQSAALVARRVEQAQDR